MPGVASGMRPFRFGVGPGGVRAGLAPTWPEFARRLEHLGFDVLSAGDHITMGMMGPVAALATAAAATTTLRVGSLTFGNDYRHPLVLAQEVATLDVLSGGRVDFGVGAGWESADYVALGMPMDRPGVRIERLEEAIVLYKRFFSGEEFSYRGRYYTVAPTRGRPVPVQRPGPPLVVGGGGRRLLTLAAQQADVVAINATLSTADMTTDRRNSASLGDTRAKVDIVRAAAGSRLDQIELGIYIHFCSAVSSPSERADAAARISREMGMSEEDATASPHVLLGTVGEIAQKLQAMRADLGISYVSIDAVSVDDLAPVVAQLAGT